MLSPASRLSKVVELINTIAEITLDPSDPKAPYAVPTMVVTSIFHTTNTIYAHLRYMRSGQTCFALSEIGSGGLAAVGFWWYVEMPMLV